MLLAVEGDRFAGEGNAHVVHVHVVAAVKGVCAGGGGGGKFEEKHVYAQRCNTTPLPSPCLRRNHIRRPPHPRHAVVPPYRMHKPAIIINSSINHHNRMQQTLQNGRPEIFASWFMI